MKKKYSGRKRAGLVVILRRSSYQSTALKTLYNFTFEPTLIGWNAWPQMDENIRRQSPLSPEFAVKRSTGSNWTQNFRCKFMQMDLIWKGNFDSVTNWPFISTRQTTWNEWTFRSLLSRQEIRHKVRGNTFQWTSRWNRVRKRNVSKKKNPETFDSLATRCVKIDEQLLAWVWRTICQVCDVNKLTVVADVSWMLKTRNQTWNVPHFSLFNIQICLFKETGGTNDSIYGNSNKFLAQKSKNGNNFGR